MKIRKRIDLFKSDIASHKLVRSFFLTSSLISLSYETPLKPLILAILISPRNRIGTLGDMFLLFSRNIIALTGILWTFHSLLGYVELETLRSKYLALLILIVSVQIIKKWDIKEDSQQVNVRIQSVYFSTLLSAFLFSFLNFPQRLSTFLLGWDHLNGHLWLTAQLYQEGYIRIDSNDGIGIYPKAEFPLILNFSNAVVDFQSLVQSVIFIEVLLFVATLSTLHGITFRKRNEGMNSKVTNILATLMASPFLFYFIFYGWTSLLLTVCALLVLTWHVMHVKDKNYWLILFCIATAAVQSWILITPVVALIIFSSKLTQLRKEIIIFSSLFVLINAPSINAILQFNGLDQVSDGFKSNSLLFFFLFMGMVIPILYLLRSKNLHVAFKVLIAGNYFGALLIWVGTSQAKQLPYYAIKVFLITLLVMTPYFFQLTIGIIKSEKIRSLTASALIIGYFGFGTVPASSYSYLDFITGRNLKTNWLSENLIAQTSRNKDRVILNSHFVIDVEAVKNIGDKENHNLFAYDQSYICDRSDVSADTRILSDPDIVLEKCDSS